MPIVSFVVQIHGPCLVAGWCLIHEHISLDLRLVWITTSVGTQVQPRLLPSHLTVLQLPPLWLLPVKPASALVLLGLPTGA